MGCDSSRLMVRREYSPLMASNPRPIAIRGIRNPSSEANEGMGARAVVNTRRNTNGSSAVVLRICCRAPYSAAAAVSTISHSSTRMRALLRWSANSFSVTAPSPFQGEPLRFCMVVLLGAGFGVVEVAVVDGVQAGQVDRQAMQVAARLHDRARGIGAHVVFGQQAIVA